MVCNGFMAPGLIYGTSEHYVYSVMPKLSRFFSGFPPRGSAGWLVFGLIAMRIAFRCFVKDVSSLFLWSWLF